MMKKILLVVIAFLFLVFFLVGLTQTSSTEKISTQETKTVQTQKNSNKKQQDYIQAVSEIETKRLSLASEYKKAQNETDKRALIEKAKDVFVQSIHTELFHFWYGTDWDFYGTTEKPNQGKIACGYFVTTVLRDTGLKVNRVSLAQQASENIIKSLTTETHIKRFRNVSIGKFVEEVKSLGAGIYVVGLDIHVGFIYHDGDEVYFIHSSYAEPYEVVKEKAITSPILSGSKYRVVGKISADNHLIIKWLNSEQIPTKKR